MTRSGEQGQASVELLAVLPVVILLAVSSWQCLVAAEGWWLSGIAARAADRAARVGLDPLAAARTSLPGAWGRRATLHDGDAGEQRVRIAIPVIVAGAQLGSASAPFRSPMRPDADGSAVQAARAARPGAG